MRGAKRLHRHDLCRGPPPLVWICLGRALRQVFKPLFCQKASFAAFVKGLQKFFFLNKIIHAHDPLCSCLWSSSHPPQTLQVSEGRPYPYMIHHLMEKTKAPMPGWIFLGRVKGCWCLIRVILRCLNATWNRTRKKGWASHIHQEELGIYTFSCLKFLATRI